MSTKITVNLPDNTVEGLREIADNRGITVTEALRQTIESQQFLDNEIRGGGKVLVETPDRPTRQIIFNVPQRSKK